MLLTLSTLLLASPASASPLPPRTRPAGVASSNAFHLLTVPRDPSLPIGTLMTLHTGAGQNRAGVSYEADAQPLVFYQNATGAEGVVVHDVLPQGYPLRIFVEEVAAAAPAGSATLQEGERGAAEESSLRAVHLTVSGATLDLGVAPAPRPVLSYREGSFWTCEESDTPSLPGTWTLLSWAAPSASDSAGEEARARGCDEVLLVPVCDDLPDLPEEALGSHEFVAEARCFVDVEAVECAFGRRE